MSELKSGTDEISDALKEKVLLSILKNQFHRDVVDEVETPEDFGKTNLKGVPDTGSESDDVPKSPSGSRGSTDPESRPLSSPGDRNLETLGRGNTDQDCREQERTATTATQDDSTKIEHRSPEASEHKQTTESEDQEKTASGDQKTEGESVDETLPAPDKDDVKPDPIKELEERLAAEESLLSLDQLKERHGKSQSLRAQANNLYKESAFNDAAVKYNEALQICPLNEEKDRSILYANRAAALMANHQNKEALPHLDRALELDPNYLKALERRARLNKLLENLDDSLKDYQKLLELRPKQYAYIATIKELEELIKKRDEELKAKMLDSLKQLGNVFLKPFGLSTENFSMVPNEGGGYSLQMKGQK